MGFFSGLGEEKYDRQYSDRDLIKRILEYFVPYRKNIILISILIFLMSAFGSLLPIIVSNGMDLLVNQADINYIFVIPLIVLLLGISNWVANYFRRRLTMRTIAGVATKMAEMGFRAAADHDLSFYDEISSGKVVSRITSDTREFANLITLITDVFSQLLQALILAIVLLSIDVKLSLITFSMVPVIFLMSMSFRKLARKVTRAGMRAMATVNATIKETVSGISVAKNFRQEEAIFSQFDEANMTSYRVNIRRGLVLSFVFPVLNAIGAVVTSMLVYFGSQSVVATALTAGTWYLFIQSQDLFMFPIMNLSSFITQVQTGLSAAERVFALIDAEAQVKQNGKQVLSHIKGNIRFDNLYFHYKDNEPVLRDFNLDIKTGENIAFVGHTGAGKSSIAKLIARFYEYQEGAILIDGVDIRSLDLSKYRKNLGIVTQVPFLFSQTVLENIRYANPGAEIGEITEMANKIGNGEWVETLPDGFDTHVGERGSRLSMGQRQLVALMRVLMQKPAIFILDEATASIDPFTELQIQQALNLVLSQTTSILIAHRLSTIKSADRIIVLDNGKIIEEGNHQNLLDQHGHYASLYNTYFRHQSLEYVNQANQLKQS